MAGMAGQHRAAARLRQIADEQPVPAVVLLRRVGKLLHQTDQLGMTPIAVARQPHRLPGRTIDRQCHCAREATARIRADGTRLQQRGIFGGAEQLLRRRSVAFRTARPVQWLRPPPHRPGWRRQRPLRHRLPVPHPSKARPVACRRPAPGILHRRAITGFIADHGRDLRGRRAQGRGRLACWDRRSAGSFSGAASEVSFGPAGLAPSGSAALANDRSCGALT